MERIAYAGWHNCLRLSNDHIELIVTADIGPRIIRFGFVGGENEFAEYPAMLGQKGGDEWRIYGGHRLWHAPEDPQRSYYPDNEPVQVKAIHGGLRVTQPIETTTGIGKEMDIRLVGGSARVSIVHRLRNHGLWPVKLAPWALSVMAPGGKAILPLPARGAWPETLLGTQTITLWPYTDMSDPRWTWGRQYILLQQDSQRDNPQKIGLTGSEGWLAYARKGHLFLKTYTHIPGATYPDLGCGVEVYTSPAMLELETLGPLTLLPPGGLVEHSEQWWLYQGVPVPLTEHDVESTVTPQAQQARQEAGGS